MLLNEKAFFNYIYCPIMFHVEQKMSLNGEKTSNNKKDVLNTIDYFYSGILDGKLRTYKEIEKKFYASQEALKKEDLISEWEKVISIIEWSKEEKIMIGDLNKPYCYTTEKDNKINGIINYIIINQNKHIMLLYFDLSSKRLDKSYLSRKLKYTLDYFGFEKAYGKKPDFIKIHSVKYNEDYVFYKTEDDRARLNLTIDQVCHCIEEQITFPRESYLCKTCNYSSYCTYWNKGGE